MHSVARYIVIWTNVIFPLAIAASAERPSQAIKLRPAIPPTRAPYSILTEQNLLSSLFIYVYEY